MATPTTTIKSSSLCGGGSSLQLARPRVSTSALRRHSPRQTALPPPLPGTCCFRRRRPLQRRPPVVVIRTAGSSALSGSGGDGGEKEKEGTEDERRAAAASKQQQRWTPFDPAVAVAAAVRAALRGAAAATVAARSSFSIPSSPLSLLPSTTTSPADAAAQLKEATRRLALHLEENLAETAARAWLLFLACLAPPTRLLSAMRSRYARSSSFRNLCRSLAVAAGTLALTQLWINTLLIPDLNRRRLPQAEAAISRVTGREVSLGVVRGIYPGRLVSRLGGDLVVVGPVRVGPGPAERSSAEVSRLSVSLGLGLSGREVKTKVHLKCEGASVDLVQGGNLSWAGYPDDLEVEVEGKATAAAGVKKNSGTGTAAAPAPAKKVVVSARDWLPGLSDAAAPASTVASLPAPAASSSSSSSRRPPPPPPFAWISPASVPMPGGKGKGAKAGGGGASAAAAAPVAAAEAATAAAAASDRAKSIWGSSAPVFEFDDASPPAKASTAKTSSSSSSSAPLDSIRPVASRGIAGMTSSAASLKGGKEPAATAPAAPAAPVVVAPPPSSASPFPKDVSFSFDDGAAAAAEGKAADIPSPSPSSVAATAARAAADTAARLRARLEAAVARKEERATAAKKEKEMALSSSSSAAAAAAAPSPVSASSSLIENMIFEFSDAVTESEKAKEEEKKKEKEKKEKVKPSPSNEEAKARVAAASPAAVAASSATEQPSPSSSSSREQEERKERYSSSLIDLGTFELPPAAPAAAAAADAAAVASPAAAAAPPAAPAAPGAPAAPSPSAAAPAEHKPRRHAPSAAARPATTAAAAAVAQTLSAPQSTYRPAEAPHPSSSLAAAAGNRMGEAPWWLPSPVLSSVSLSDASLRVHFAGDAPAAAGDEGTEAAASSPSSPRGRRGRRLSRHPRRVEGISARLRLSSDYDALDVALSGTAHERGPEADRCTMPPAAASKAERAESTKKGKALAATGKERATEAATTTTTPPPPPVRSLRASARRAPIVQDGVTPPDAAEIALYAKAQRMAAAERGGGSPFVVADASTTSVAAEGESGPRLPQLLRLRRSSRPDGDLTSKPTGGKLGVRVSAKNLLSLFAAKDEEKAAGSKEKEEEEAKKKASTPPPPPPLFPELVIAVRGDDLHAPLLERVLDVPIDAYSGRVSGEVVVSFAGDGRRGVAAEDAGSGSWAPGALPHLSGRVRGTGLDFHFWGSPDDCEEVDVELAIEGDTLFFQRARGRFGAAPLDVTGEVRLDGGVVEVPISSSSSSSASLTMALMQTNDGGRYRLAADVSGPGGVEVNALRETLGLRPLPVPVAGAIAGSLRVSGRLEEPVFSGTAVAVRPPVLPLGEGEGGNASQSPSALLEPSEAQDALRSAPAHAVGAYDRVPVASAEALFSMDTAADLFTLHSLRASPLLSNSSSNSSAAGGGENGDNGGTVASSSSTSSTTVSAPSPSPSSSYGTITGSGVISVSPQAENDPRALRMEFEGRGIPADALLSAYLPGSSSSSSNSNPLSLISGTSSPSLLGLASGSATLTGSHVDATLRARWEAPEASASGTVELSREAIAAAVDAPALAARARLRVRAPSVEAQKLALTQRAASELAKPDVRGVEVEADFRGLDLAPLLLQAGDQGDAATISRLAATRQRLRLAGTAAFQGAFDDDEEVEEGGKEGEKDLLHHHHHHHHRRSPKQAFSGKLSLDSLRLNSLRLSRTLEGTLKVSRASGGLALHAKGLRPDEALDLEVGVPLLERAGLFAEREKEAKASEKKENFTSSSVLEQQQQSESSSSGGSSAEEEVEEVRAAVAAADAAAAAASAAAARSTLAAPPAPPLPPLGARLNLRCGRLSLAAEASDDLSSLDASARGLSLDGLELASLRGTVDDAAVSVNARLQSGRARLALAAPRFSGLSGESLAASLRWDRDVLRLERASLVQPRSRYEVSGEYVIPAGTLPVLVGAETENENENGGRALSEVVDDLMAATEVMPTATTPTADQSSSSTSPSSAPPPPPSITQGRWRLQVNVPSAELEELVPGARLLRRAAALAPTDYQAAKAAFLARVGDTRIAASGLAEQLAAAAADVADAFADVAAAAAAEGGKDGESGEGDAAAAAAAAAAAEEAEEERQASTPSSSSSSAAAAAAARRSNLTANLTGLQDLKGTWSGWVTAYGGGGGATAADFDVRGANWRWGGRDGGGGASAAAGSGVSDAKGASDGRKGGKGKGKYSKGGNSSSGDNNSNENGSNSFGGIPLLDTAVARGCAHSEEGLRLDEAGLRSGDAALALRGNLFGSAATKQDARLLVTDFPVAKLTPALRALVPALSHAAPAAAALPNSSSSLRDGAKAGEGGGGDGLQQQQQQRSAAAATAATSAPERIAALLGLGRPLAALRSAAGGVLGGGGSASSAAAPPSSTSARRRGGGGVFGGSSSSSSSADPSSLASVLSSSPVGGLLCLKASVGGTAADPTAAATARLFDGALGATRLAAAEGSATLGADGRLEFSASLEPAKGGGGGGGGKDAKAASAAGGGIVRASGSLPLRSPSSSLVPSSSSATAEQPLPVPLLAPDEVSIDASVRDGGMTLVAGLAPAGTRWLGGAADVRLRVRGRAGGGDASSSSSPSPSPPMVVTAAARVARGGLALPFLRAPATGITADVEVTSDGVLRVRELSGRVGRKGSFSASGALPLGGGGPAAGKQAASSVPSPSSSAAVGSPAAAAAASADPSIVLELDSLDVRARPRYSGLVDAAISLRGSAKSPVVGGHVRLSKGVLSLVPPGEEEGNSGAKARSGVLATRAVVRGGAASAAAAAAGTPLPADPAAPKSDTTAASSRAARRKEARQQHAASASYKKDEPGLLLRGLDIRLGPELRGVYPFVVNVGLSGGLLADGDPSVAGAAAASPLPLPGTGEGRAAARARFASRLRLGGAVTLDGGEVNLLATRFVLDREHTNRVTFDNSSGFGSGGSGGFAGVMGFGNSNKKSALGTAPSPDDPALDLVLRGAGMRVAILTPRASAWRQGLTLTAASSSSSSSSSSSPATATAATEGGAADASAGGGGSAAPANAAAASPATTAAARRAAAVAGGGSIGSGSSSGGGGSADPLAAEDAARLFEAALARAVVSEDGRLALPALAAAAAHSFMPKIQTQGALGQARWRLVSAPSVAGLFALDSPTTAATSAGGGGDKNASSKRSRGQGGSGASLLESLALGTEVEVQFGKSLRASLSRPLRDASASSSRGGGGGGPAACTLTYALTSHVRVQFSVGGGSGNGAGGGGGGGGLGGGAGPRSLVIQYSSDVSS